MHHPTEESLRADLAAIASIASVNTMLDVICQTTGMGFAVVSRVTEQRWIACAVLDKVAFGLQPGSELEIKSTICDEIRDSGIEVVIDHVARDATYRDHHTPRQYGLQSYISVPIFRRNKEFFGTLCAIDASPAELQNSKTVNMFRLFAELIGSHLDAQETMRATQTALADANETAALREQFIAVLGHDLRNPLQAIGNAATLLRQAPPERAPGILAMMERSVARMSGLIDNVLDFARGRSGGGLDVRRQPVPAPALRTALEHVVQELASAWPANEVRATMALAGTGSADNAAGGAIDCDPARIGQLLSNLLGNALAHGAPGGPVTVEARVRGGQFELAVSNQGTPIPAQLLPTLFQPFLRGSARREGLGLGLYIVAEIARAHGGAVQAVSDADGTRFAFTMPLGG